MAERRYNDKELAEILRSAALAQAEGTDHSADNNGLTLADIEKLATEVGIDPTHIARAAENLGPKSEGLRRTSRTRQVVERTFDGTLDDQAWEEVVAELRLAFGGVGVVSEVGSSREWAGGGFTTVHLSATPRNGKTRIRFTLRPEGSLVIGWLVAFMACMFGSMGLGIPMSRAGTAGISVFGAVFALIFTIITVTTLSLSNVNRKNLKLADDFLGKVKTLIPAVNASESIESRLADAPSLDESRTIQPTQLSD